MSTESDRRSVTYIFCVLLIYSPGCSAFYHDKLVEHNWNVWFIFGNDNSCRPGESIINSDTFWLRFAFWPGKKFVVNDKKGSQSRQKIENRQ